MAKVGNSFDSLKNELSKVKGKEEKKDRNEEVSKYRSKQKEENKYYEYESIPVKAAKNGDKYKANFSLEEDTMQKIQMMLLKEGYGTRDKSKIPERGIHLLYDIYYMIKLQKNIDIFSDEISIDEIIDIVNDCEKIDKKRCKSDQR